MKVACVLAILSSLQYLVLAQSGSGQEPGSISVALQVRIKNEEFDDTLKDTTSQEYLSLKDSVQTNLETEFRNGMTGANHVYNDLTVQVTKFTNGSVIVAFVVTIEGTAINAAELLEVAQSISADGTIGSFTVDEIQDLDECADASVTCAEFAECANTVGSFRCDCEPDFYDESGNGTVCVTPVEVLCEPDKIEISIVRAYLDSLSLGLDDLRLENETCGGTENATSGQYTFTILNDISSCGSEITDNTTHITYSNVLSNKAKSDAVIITGTDISIPFSCSYPVTLNTSLDPFEGEVSSINITGPDGNGEFGVDLVLYETSSFAVRQTKTEFTTSENLFVQTELDSSVPSLTVVLERCWATPSSAINDSTYYEIIADRCEVSSAVDGTVSVLQNGASGNSRFSVQVFKFVDEDTTFVHCSVSLCSTANGNTCVPDCTASGSRRRRDVSDQPTMILSRAKRSTLKNENDTVGPFYRVEVTGIDTLFWGVVMSLVFIVLVLLAIIGCLVVRRRRDEDNVRGLKVRSFGEDNYSYS